MAEGHMLKVGPFVFSLGTAAHQQLTRQDNWRWATLERIGNELHNQNIGPGERTITLDGVVFSLFDAGRSPYAAQVVGLNQVAAMRGLGDAGVPLPVTDGMGNYFGRWVVTALRETQSVFLRNGAPKKQEFSLTLRFYGQGRSGGGALGFGGLGNLQSLTAVFASSTALGSISIGTTITASDGVKSAMLEAGVTLGEIDG